MFFLIIEKRNTIDNCGIQTGPDPFSPYLMTKQYGQAKLPRPIMTKEKLHSVCSGIPYYCVYAVANCDVITCVVRFP